SGQFPKNPNPHRGVIPKRGYVTQRSGVPPSPKSNFAAFSGKGHEAIFEFHASPLPAVSPRRRISLARGRPNPPGRRHAVASYDATSGATTDRTRQNDPCGRETRRHG